MGKRLIAVASGIFLFGCTSSISQRLQPVLAPAANIGDSVACQSGCKEEWERAQLWIAKHANTRIQLSTDVLIQTYNSDNGLDAIFSITKEPAGGGNYIIRMAANCGNPVYGCDPKPLDIRNAFYYYVKTGTDLLQGQGYLWSIR